MRIAIVSAHYPPNFVSGGTLVPQRIAQTLADRGHQVFVFAGELLPGEPDGQLRVEQHGSIEVTWLSIIGRLGWEDRNNYTSTAVQGPFLDFLRRVRPDVVHLHTLQGLGGGLVPLAAASGAATVVTMHDMWWWCSRQFLVEKDLTPCSTVVDTGVCPCSVDNPWLRARNAELAAHLAAADLVLAPSTPMTVLLAANGVAPDRLALDENPSPDAVRTPPPRTTRPAGAPVRFVFAGGPFPVKGGPLALAAAGRLADLDGWSMDLYGIDAPARMPAHTRARPAYPADQVGSVLAGYDVLVMSSVMLESYSLLTREALAAGLVVVTGDNPGPTEVVRHGVNGLVFPRGDEVALADALRSLVVDPGLLEKLRPAPGGLTLRSLTEQAAGLETHYRRILDTRPAAEFAAPLQRVLVVSGITGAPLRYRGYLPAEALTGLGVHVDVVMYREERLPALAAAADAVVFYRVPATDQIRELISTIRARVDPVVPILYDIDDLVVDPDLAGELDPILIAAGVDLELYWQGVRRYRTTLEECDGYIGSTPYLCERIGELTGMPTHRFANGVGRELARASDAQLRRPRAAGPVRIGYFSGTNTHNEDWAFIEPAVARLLAARPAVQLWIGGLLETSEALAPFASRVRRLPLTPWYELPALLRDLDVNLAPLQPGRTFNEAKSAIKYLEAALVRTPTVASPSQPFTEAIVDGRNGVLARTADEWLAALTELVDDPARRDRLGAAAREQVLIELSPARQGHRYLDILLAARDLVAQQGHRSAPGWTPVSTDEPVDATVPDYYGALVIAADGTVSLGAAGHSRLRRYAASARVMVRDEGVLATARKAAPIGTRFGVRAARALLRRGRALARRLIRR